MSIQPLSPPDSHFVSAAVGWIELGDFAEATAELDRINPQLGHHPEVLEIRWQIEAHFDRWQNCADIAQSIIKVAPRLEFGWVHLSYALHEMKKTAEARDNLLKVVDLFPRDSTMRYNLACYECQLGHIDRARQWYEAALQLGDAKEIKRIMLDDPDLEPLKKLLGNK